MINCDSTWFTVSMATPTTIKSDVPPKKNCTFKPCVIKRGSSASSVSPINGIGAVYLAMVAILPEFLLTGFKVAPIPFIGETLDAILPRFITQGLNVQFFFGGTSLLIVVGVAMDTVNQVESQLIMRHYDGFMKKTRIRGRRG